MKKAVTLAVIIMLYLLSSIAVASAYSYGPSYHSSRNFYKPYNNYHYSYNYYRPHHFNSYRHHYNYRSYNHRYYGYHRPRYHLVYPFSGNSHNFY